MRLITIVLLLVFVLVGADLEARSFRVSQIPNGSKFGCTNCHTGFGGPRNAFGQVVGSSYLDAGGNVIWGAALAALDSDGDGVSNGGELQDPAGVWKIGDPQPGDLALVSNPGDPNSTTAVRFAYAPAFFVLYQNHPNPFNPSTTLTFTLPHHASVKLTVYDMLGRPVRELVNESLPAGEHQAVWNATDENGALLGSGFYFARFESENVVQTIRMLLMK